MGDHAVGLELAAFDHGGGALRTVRRPPSRDRCADFRTGDVATQDDLEDEFGV